MLHSLELLKLIESRTDSFQTELRQKIIPRISLNIDTLNLFRYTHHMNKKFTPDDLSQIIRESLERLTRSQVVNLTLRLRYLWN